MNVKREINYDQGHDVRGPTAERLGKAGDAFVVGGEDRGVRIYYFMDAPLQRLYARLRLKAGTKEGEELTREYTALMKYRWHWHRAGYEASLPSVDLNRLSCSDPSTRHGMSMGEKQIDHQQKYRAAVEKIGHKPHILLENFACYEHPLHIACYTIGYSLFRGRRLVRATANQLADHWGIG